MTDGVPGLPGDPAPTSPVPAQPLEPPTAPAPRTADGATTAARLGGRYELREVLGYGGMAEVRRGHDVRLGRDIAVKTLRPDLARDPSFLERFRREAQSAAALNHPSVVSIFDTGEERVGEAVTPYIVMEFVDGRTLRDVLRTDGRMLPQRALATVAEVLRALDYSHRTGIVHRDIKPGNVMLTRAGAVKVMDFGISRAMSAATSTMTATAAVVGTAQYLSPEQARGEHVDHRSDVYSAGCLLYELLTGRPPFSGDNPVAIAYQHVREDPVPPSQVAPDLPAGVDAVVLTAMAKDPARRYQTAGEMREDLERLLAGQPVRAAVAVPAAAAASATVLARPAGAPLRKRRRGLAYALLALAVVAVFLVAALLARLLLAGSGGGAVATPDVQHLPKDQAVSRLADAGLRSAVTRTQPSFSEPAGNVLSQYPLPQISVRKGDVIQLVVSGGAPPTTVPNVIGQSIDDATAELQKARLRVGSTTNRDDKSPQGTVLGSDPAPGTSVDNQAGVRLVLASGRNTVPNVTQQGQYDARSSLADAGFRYRSRGVVDPGAVPGTVLRQEPAAGSVQAVGSVVTLTVAQSPPRPSPRPTEALAPEPVATPTPTPTPKPSAPAPTPRPSPAAPPPAQPSAPVPPKPSPSR